MSTNSRIVTASPEQVWRVLSDGWLYPVWVVGATRMRDVDDAWPAVGSQLHHSVGIWPVVVDDTTEVLEVRAPEYLRLRARAWPGGEAEVELLLEPAEGGTRVTIVEDVVKGPTALTPEPLRKLPLLWRNRETLRRLAFIAERREPARSPGRA